MKNKLGHLIIYFLLPLPNWYIIGNCLVYQTDLDPDEKLLKYGFVWHYWDLPKEVLIYIYTHKGTGHGKKSRISSK